MDECEVFMELKIVFYYFRYCVIVENQVMNYFEEYGLWFINKGRLLENFKQRSDGIIFLILVNVFRNLMENNLKG